MSKCRPSGLSPAQLTDQHVQIVSLISSLRTAHEAGTAWEDLARAIDVIIERFRGHFADEQAAMAAATYPGLGEHRAEHTIFLRRLQVLRAECDRRETELMGTFIDLLKGWLKKHERTDDARFFAFVHRGNPGSAPGKGRA